MIGDIDAGHFQCMFTNSWMINCSIRVLSIRMKKHLDTVKWLILNLSFILCLCM